MKRKAGLLISGALVVSLLAGCGASNNASPSNSQAPAGTNSAAPSAGEAKKPSDIKVGALFYTYTIPQVQAVMKVQDEQAAKLGIKVVNLDSQGDAQKQTQQLNNLLVQKVDAVVIEPVDTKGVIPVLKKFYDAGIPVIDSILPVDESGMQYVTSFIGIDNIQDGKNGAKLMQEALPNGGKVAVIEGAPGTTSAVQRTQGFEEGLKGTNIEVVDKQTAMWDRTKALQTMQDLLSKHPNLNGVFVHSDDMAMGALQAIKAAGKLGKIMVIGHDGSKEAVQAIEEGSMYGSVVELLLWEGQKSIQVAADAAMGKPVEKRYIPEPMLLTKKNLAEYKAAF
ncbi:sugar ABC transporter substrate-binding protein [Ferviditalea candida]|uniref:Sugar ABC transporter substrate-binding protein n=1 Tax=Ferviditalea candida TaxID=3108399 RepID=A0ABU5ZHK0_9BACL|nr:sugar ABC transporter substrate-binding protein [Paenibacillaceae bacterium T2]